MYIPDWKASILPLYHYIGVIACELLWESKTWMDPRRQILGAGGPEPCDPCGVDAYVPPPDTWTIPPVSVNITNDEVRLRFLGRHGVADGKFTSERDGDGDFCGDGMVMGIFYGDGAGREKFDGDGGNFIYNFIYIFVFFCAQCTQLPRAEKLRKE